MIKNDDNIRTRRWTRSPRGELLGVATGLAEWKGFPSGTTRLIIFLIVVFSGIFPGAIVYLIAAVILPEQKDEDVISPKKDSEYEKMKKKVEEMESSLDDKERSWDLKFKGEKK